MINMSIAVQKRHQQTLSEWSGSPPTSLGLKNAPYKERLKELGLGQTEKKEGVKILEVPFPYQGVQNVGDKIFMDLQGSKVNKRRNK